MHEKYAALRGNVGLLGQLLGKTIKDHLGEEFLAKIETIRQLAKSSRRGNEDDRQTLLDTLRNLSDDELLPVARAFSQFLNLANVAEMFHTTSRKNDEFHSPDELDKLFAKLKAENKSSEEVLAAIKELDIELVLTAHPTEVQRRTLIHKHVQLNECLEQLELGDLSERERHYILHRIEQLINQAWHTNEIREIRPTPVDEAKWGFAVIENSLWPAMPYFMRQLDERLEETFGLRLPLDSAPVRFASWMGGDRDGNPFVTAKVTREVLLTSRWVALTLFQTDVQELVSLQASLAQPNVEKAVAYSRSVYEISAQTQEEVSKVFEAQLTEFNKTVAGVLEPGGILCCYVATTTQMGRVMDTLRADGGFTEPTASEVMVRDWHAEGLAIRPGHATTAHTGFLVMTRRMASSKPG